MAQKQIPGIETTLDRDDVKSSEDYRIVRDTSTGSDAKTPAGSAGGYDVGTDDDEVPTNADLGSASLVDTGTADDEVPTNSNASGLTWSDESTGDKYQLAIVDGCLMLKEA